MKTRFSIPSEQAELDSFLAENPRHEVRVGPDFVVVSTGDDLTKVMSVSAWQIRKAINSVPGLRAKVDAFLSSDTTPRDVIDGFEVANEWLRYDPLLLSVTDALGLSEDMVDDLFKLADTL